VIGELLIVTVAIALIVWAVRQYKPAKQRSVATSTQQIKTTNRIRLTNEQINCLSSASSGAALYGETRNFRFSQMPNGSSAYDLRTINSLVKRGYLKPDGCGGYVKTEATDSALRSATGF